MSKNIFIAGKDFPSVFDLADGFILRENTVVIASSAENAENVPAGVKTVTWTRNSGVSARSAVIQAETEAGFADDFILYYDSLYFSEQFKDFSIENCAEACDTLISSFQFLAIEILNRIKQRKYKSRLIFALKSHPSAKDLIVSPGLRNYVQNPSNPFVATGEAAFATFAENIAVLSAENDNLSVLLISGDEQNEVMQKDSTFAQWLTEYINASDELKNKPTVKQATSWIKAGAKNPGGFSLFR